MQAVRTSRVGVLAALLAAACGEAVAPRPNVVVIVVDTLRADRLGTYGCPRDTAPFLDELARDGVVFENAWAASSWTLPSAVSAITSVHPFQHGVTDYDGLELAPGEEPTPVNCIPSEVETLAEVLGGAGYRTYGVVSNVLVGPEVGFDRGFEHFVRLEDEDADAVNAWVTSWSAKMLAEEPFFLYVHYFDPHDPFHAREPWFEEALADGALGWPDLVEEFPDTYADLDWLATRLEPAPDWLEGRRASELPPEEQRRLVDWMRAAYDSEIRFVDSRIRALYELLGLEDSVVVFLADHGEEFYEHGELTHGQNLHVETVRVPFFLTLPAGRRSPGRVSEPVTTLDLVPTLRGLLGLTPSEQDQGRDLLVDQEPRPILGHLAGRASDRAFEGEIHSLLLGRYRLITTPEGRPRLFDVGRDPGEKRDLAREDPELVRELRGLLEGSLRSSPSYPRATRIPEVASEAMLEHLSGIGYAGAGEQD